MYREGFEKEWFLKEGWSLVKGDIIPENVKGSTFTGKWKGFILSKRVVLKEGWSLVGGTCTGN